MPIFKIENSLEYIYPSNVTKAYKAPIVKRPEHLTLTAFKNFKSVDSPAIISKLVLNSCEKIDENQSQPDGRTTDELNELDLKEQSDFSSNILRKINVSPISFCSSFKKQSIKKKRKRIVRLKSKSQTNLH